MVMGSCSIIGEHVFGRPSLDDGPDDPEAGFQENQNDDQIQAASLTWTACRHAFLLEAEGSEALDNVAPAGVLRSTGTLRCRFDQSQGMGMTTAPIQGPPNPSRADGDSDAHAHGGRNDSPAAGSETQGC
ncbi:hypothetical protein CCHR01_16943 [Colletotrichum chrysophilum]|uniref:Uncharacterized protein n=1 Tax=Colletotrichum chrysophilum TaxID=1836956 RepID=A0AAD9A5G8_9PEZI|nr:hypothetical protein CCHR01_16943 [Colletotrichum chrysophilum]